MKIVHETTYSINNVLAGHMLDTFADVLSLTFYGGVFKFYII